MARLGRRQPNRPHVSRRKVLAPVTLLEDFEGVGNGVTITTANTIAQFVDIGVGGSAVGSTTAPIDGSSSGVLTHGTPQGANDATYLEFDCAGMTSDGSLHVRVRLVYPVLPAATIRALIITAGNGAFIAELRFPAAGLITFHNPAGTLQDTQSVRPAYTAGELVDIGVAVTLYSATVGTIEAALFDPTDGSIAETLTSAGTHNTVGAGGTPLVIVGASQNNVAGLASFVTKVDDWTATNTGTWPTLPNIAGGPTLVDLAPAAALVAAQPFTATPGMVSVALVPAAVEVTAQPLTATPTPSSAALVPAPVTVTAQAMSATPGMVSVSLVPAPIVVAGQPVTATPGPVTVALGAAPVTVAGQPLSATPGMVTVALVPAPITVAAQPFTMAGQVVLAPAGVLVAAQPVTPVPGPVTVALAPASVLVTPRPLTATPGPASVSLAPAAVAVQARPVTAVPGPVTVALAPAAVSVAAQVLAVILAGGPADLSTGTAPVGGWRGSGHRPALAHGSGHRPAVAQGVGALP